MRIRLVRKFANAINGIDLAMVSVGDVVELQTPQAVLLIREGWVDKDFVEAHTEGFEAFKTHVATFDPKGVGEVTAEKPIAELAAATASRKAGTRAASSTSVRFP